MARNRRMCKILEALAAGAQLSHLSVLNDPTLRTTRLAVYIDRLRNNYGLKDLIEMKWMKNDSGNRYGLYYIESPRAKAAAERLHRALLILEGNLPPLEPGTTEVQENFF